MTLRRCTTWSLEQGAPAEVDVIRPERGPPAWSGAPLPEVDVTRLERGPPAWSGAHLTEVDVTCLERGPQYCRGTAVLLKDRSTAAVLRYC